MSENNQQSLPFFARYLEGQFCEDLSVEEMDEVQGGLTPHIKPKSATEVLMNPSFLIKHPIDLYRGMTNKYPSDGDDDMTFSPEIYVRFNHP